MKLSNTSSALTARFGYDRAIEITAKAGYDGIDLNLCSYTNENFDGGMWAKDVYIENAKKLRQKLTDAGLVCNQIHTPFSFSKKVWEENFEDICMPYTVRSLEIASTLGVDVCVVHPLHHFVYMGHEEEIFEKNVVFYSRLAKYARELGVRIGVENMWQCDVKRGCICHDTCSQADEFVRYIDTVNDPTVVACLDVGHVELIQRTDTTADVIRALGHNRLHALHIHDNDYKADSHMLPFSGKMDWNSICKVLGEIDYDGDFTYEFGGAFYSNVPDGFIDEAAAYSVKVGRYLMSQIDANRPKK